MSVLTYDLPHDDPLQVLSTTSAVLEKAQSVTIDQDALRRIAADLGDLMAHAPDWHDPRHFADGTWRTAGWVLVLDALNFCFWSQSANPNHRWHVEWDGRLEDGYWWELPTSGCTGPDFTGDFCFEEVYLITCEEMFLRGGMPMNIARVDIASLGDPNPPD